MERKMQVLCRTVSSQGNCLVCSKHFSPHLVTD